MVILKQVLNHKPITFIPDLTWLLPTCIFVKINKIRSIISWPTFLLSKWLETKSFAYTTYVLYGIYIKYIHNIISINRQNYEVIYTFNTAQNQWVLRFYIKIDTIQLNASRKLFSNISETSYIFNSQWIYLCICYSYVCLWCVRYHLTKQML